ILALVSRLPVGMAYNPRGARLLISIAVLVMGISNFFYSFATDGLTFAIVHSINGFAYGAVTTLYMAFYVDSLPPEENRNHAMGYYVGTLALGYSTGSVFGGLISVYGLGVGMSLTRIGVIRAAFAGCNAVTRPISGHVVSKFGHRRLSYAGIPLQSAILTLIPLFTGFGTVLTIYVMTGVMRA